MGSWRRAGSPPQPASARRKQEAFPFQPPGRTCHDFWGDEYRDTTVFKGANSSDQCVCDATHEPPASGSTCPDPDESNFFVTYAWMWQTAIAIGAFGLLVSCAIALRRLRRAWVRAKKAEVEERKLTRARLEKCIEMMSELYHPVVFLRYDTFRDQGALKSHETMMAAGHLWICHTYEDLLLFGRKHATVFFSHQCAASLPPDDAAPSPPPTPRRPLLLTGG